MNARQRRRQWNAKQKAAHREHARELHDVPELPRMEGEWTSSDHDPRHEPGLRTFKARP